MTFKNNLKGYQLAYSAAAKKTLKKLDQSLAQKIDHKLVFLTQGKENTDVKKLQAYAEPTYRMRVGVMRVIFSIWKQQLIVYVIEIDHRKDIYD